MGANCYQNSWQQNLTNSKEPVKGNINRQDSKYSLFGQNCGMLVALLPIYLLPGETLQEHLGCFMRQGQTTSIWWLSWRCCWSTPFIEWQAAGGVCTCAVLLLGLLLRWRLHCLTEKNRCIVILSKDVVVIKTWSGLMTLIKISRVHKVFLGKPQLTYCFF